MRYVVMQNIPRPARAFNVLSVSLQGCRASVTCRCNCHTAAGMMSTIWVVQVCCLSVSLAVSVTPKYYFDDWTKLGHLWANTQQKQDRSCRWQQYLMSTTRNRLPAATATISPDIAMDLVTGSAGAWMFGAAWPFFFHRFFTMLLLSCVPCLYTLRKGGVRRLKYVLVLRKCKCASAGADTTGWTH
jgi:hypothetical protein